MKNLLWILLMVISSTATAQVKIDGAYYYPASALVGDGNVVGVEYRSSLPEGKVTIAEKNICPQNYHGGTLYKIIQFLNVLTNATIINSEIYAQWPPVMPSGVTAQSSGSMINTLGPPFPTSGQTVTFQNIFTPALYFYSMTCYYNNGCPEEGPYVGLCQWNAPSYWIGINLAANPPEDSLDLFVGTISVPADLAADGKPAVSPGKVFQVDVPISGSGFNNPENRSTLVTLQIGSQTLQQSVSLSGISSGGISVPFSVILPPDDVGDQIITATVDPLNSLGETNRQNNISRQSVHVLCKVADKGTEVPWFYQSQAPWGSQDYANQDHKKMRNLGCMVTSLAMLFKYYGIDMSVDGSLMDPGSVNKGLKATPLFAELGPQYSSYSGYTPSGAVQANGVVAFARSSYFMKCIRSSGNVDSCLNESKTRISFKNSSNDFNETSRNLINKEICNGNPVILKVPSISSPNDPTKAHFVLATGMTVDEDGASQYFVNDPSSSRGKDQKRTANNDYIKGYRLYRPTYDPSMVFFHLSGNVDMIVTDPQGRRSGYNPITNETFSEIPGGTYFEAESISDPADPSIFTPAEVRFEGMEPISGQYKIQIFAKSSTSYRFTQYSFDESGTINGISDKNGILRAGASALIQAEHSEFAIPLRSAALNISKATFFYTHHKDMAFVSGSIATTDGRAIYSIDRYLQIKIGSFTKSIDKRYLRKIKAGRQTTYIYGSFGKNGLSISLNADTGDFKLFVGHLQLDNEDTEITTDMMIQADDVIAKGLVTFKNIRKKTRRGQ